MFQKSNKGFAIIELIVVIAIVGILVLLASPKFINKTKEANEAKHIANAKMLEDAIDRYRVDNNKFPRVSDEPYSAEMVEDYAIRIYNTTGKNVELDKDGNFYDIDYPKLRNYIKIPNKSDKQNYILQNPVGKVYYLDGLTEFGDLRQDEVKATNIVVNSENLLVMKSFTSNIKADIEPEDASFKTLKWKSQDESIATVNHNGTVTGVNVGDTVITVTNWSNQVSKSINVSVEPMFESKEINTNATFQVPVNGVYQLEVTGGRGGGNGSQGSLVIATGHFEQGDILTTFIGQSGGSGITGGGGMTGYAHRGGAGGGGSSAILKGNIRLVEAKGGRGLDGYRNSYNDTIGMGMVGNGGNGYRNGSRGGGSLPTNHLAGSGGGSDYVHSNLKEIRRSTSSTGKVKFILLAPDKE